MLGGFPVYPWETWPCSPSNIPSPPRSDVSFLNCGPVTCGGRLPAQLPASRSWTLLSSWVLARTPQACTVVGWALSAHLDPLPPWPCSLLAFCPALTPYPAGGSRAQSSHSAFSGLVSGVKTHSQSLPPLLGPGASQEEPPVHPLGKMLSILCLCEMQPPKRRGSGSPLFL